MGRRGSPGVFTRLPVQAESPAHVFNAKNGEYDPNDEARFDLLGGAISYNWKKWSKLY